METASSNKAGTRVVAYVAIGSNIEAEKHIPAALELLREEATVLSVSRMYQSAAVGRPEQADYRNGVVAIETSLIPLLFRDQVLRPIEASLGRIRSGDAYAARTIDLDLIVYGDHVFEKDGLHLPATDIRERTFVAVPLLELAPDLVLPDDGTRLADCDVAHDLASLEHDAALTTTVKGSATA